MTDRDRRVIEAMMGEADDWHIVDPETGAEIDQDGGIPVTSEQFKSLLAGESAVVGLTRRVVTLADGPFSIQRGGPGSGFKGHKGRPGEVGGSEPSATGPEEHRPVKSKRKGRATIFDARTPVAQVKDLIDTVLAETETGGEMASAIWHNLFHLANSATWTVGKGKEGQDGPLTDNQRTDLWELYHGVQRVLDKTGLRDGLDADENASLQRLGDIIGDFEPDLSGEESASGHDPAELLSLYLGDESTPGYLPEEITRDSYMRYQTGRIVARVAASMEGSELTNYNGTDNSYLDFAALQELANDNTFDPEAWNAVVETWGRRAVSEENTSEGAYAMREARLDPNFWAQNQVMELSIGQWIPRDVSPELYDTADLLNAGWKDDPQHSAGGVGLEEAAARIFGGTVPSREALEQAAPSAGSAVEASLLLDDLPAQERANRVVQGMYDGTQAWLAERGYHPGDTVRLYRGMGNIEGAWNPLQGPGEGNLQMFAASSWSFDASEAVAFAEPTHRPGEAIRTREAAMVAADIPIERLLANSDTGVPCEREGEWLVLGMDGIRGKVYRAGDPPGAWEEDLEPTMSHADMLGTLVQMRSAVCLGFLPVSVPAQVITPQGWREIAARQATAPDPSLPIINVEADGDWIGNKLAAYGLTRADVDGLAQPGTGKESAQKPQQSGKPGDEEKAKGKEGGAPNKEAGLRAYARAKRAARVRRERERSAGRQRLQSGVPPVVERGGPGSGHFGHTGRLGQVGGSLPSGEVAEEARPGGKRIVKVLSVKDTREYDDSSGKWAPILGSGIEHYCDRCGKLHEILATVQLEDGSEIIVGTSCAHAEFSEAVRRQMQSKERAARRLCQLEAEAASKKAAREAWDAGFVEVSALPLPEIVTEPETSERGFDRLRITIGDVTQHTFEMTVSDIRRNGVIYEWRSRRLRERGFEHDRPSYDEGYYAREIAKVTERLNRDLVERGGQGSGHFGHEGRPGEVGGSAPSGRAVPKTWQDMVAGFQWDAFTPDQIVAYRPGREAATFFRKQALEEMAKLDPRKITRQEFVGPDHYKLLTSAQIATMGMDRGSTLRRVLVGREYARGTVWDTAIRHQIALGLLDPRDAWEEGSPATSASRNVMGEGGWAPLPERLYHVTTAATAVARDGLLSRDDLNMELSPGLGGGESDTISFTTDFALAQDIDRALHEARMVANGEFTVAQMAEQARGGFAANAPFSEGLMPGLREGDASEESLDRFVAAEGSATSPEDFAQDRWNFYQQFLGARARAGGPANPVFFGTDYEALAQLDPADFTILEYRPRPGAMGYQVGGMSEWRTVGGDTVELLGQHQSITPETEGTILAKTWRAIMRSRGVIPRPHPLPKPKEPEKPKYAPRPDRQTYGTSIFNPQLREVVYAWPGSKGAMARAVFEKVARAQAAGNQDITGMVLGSYTEPMGLAALRYVRAGAGDVDSIQVLGMVSVGPGFGEEMWVQLAGEAAGRGVGLWVRPAKNARKFYDEIGMTFEETPDGPKCSWTAEQVATVARQAQANTDYLLPPGSTRLIPSFEDKYTETQPVTPASPDLDAPEPEGDKDWQDRYLWTDFVMGKWANREKPDANRILGGEENQKGEVKPVDGADRVEELSAAWNGGTGLGAIRLSEAVVEAYGGEPIPASVIPKDYLDKFGDKAFERVPESEVLGMAPDERTKRLADQAGKEERMLPGDFPFHLADLAEQVYDGTQTALEEAGIPLESMVRLYRGVQGDPSTLVPEGYDGGWVQTKLYALSPWTFSKAVAAAYATAPQEVGADPLPGSLIAADFPRDRVWSTWATGPGSREHFEFIVLGLEGIRGWLTRVERKGTPGPPEPPKEAKP